MPNPSTRWDKVPVYGFYFNGDDTTPLTGSVTLSFSQRVTRVDGRIIYPQGATVTRQIGDHQADAATRDAVRAEWRAADAAAAADAGETFDGAAWDAWWNVMLTGAVFVSFPASDDPDILQSGYQVRVEERLSGGSGKTFYIQPLLAHLDLVPPGINLGTIEVPPGTPTAPAPIYAKGLPGGVAALDSQGRVVDADGNLLTGEQGPPGPQGPAGPTGPPGPAGTTSWTGITDKPATFPPTIGTTGTTAKAGNYSPPAASGSVAGLMSTAHFTKLEGVATNATANGTANVTGTGVTEVVSLSQAAYDALETTVPTTLYVIS